MKDSSPPSGDSRGRWRSVALAISLGTLAITAGLSLSRADGSELVADGPEEEPTTCETGDDGVGGAPRWTSGTSGVLEVDLLSVAGRTYELHIEARLGGLASTWTQPLDALANEATTVQLSPPEGAFLHELALDYVTTLDVRVVAIDEAGNALEQLAAPVAFLAWPDGSEGAPVVWDLQTMNDQAPHGIVSGVLRDSLGDLTGVGRVLPPRLSTNTPPFDDDADGGGA
jgi:hypothetical protein